MTTRPELSADHYGKLDKAIEAHELSAALDEEMSSGRGGNAAAGEKRKARVIKELKRELYYLGVKEGNMMECKDPQQSANEAADGRGILRKRLKNGLIMEYAFSTLKHDILNFSLNNVNLELNDVPEDKLIKLLIIVRFFNSVYRQPSQAEAAEESLSPEEAEKRRREKAEENKRRLVLGKL